MKKVYPDYERRPFKDLKELVTSAAELMPDKTYFSPLFISPREIDEITNSAALVIGGAVNQACGLDL